MDIIIIDVSRLPQRADPNVENKDKKVYRTIIVKMCSASLYLHASHLRLLIVDLLSRKPLGTTFLFVFYPGETVWQDYCGLSDLVCMSPFLGSDSRVQHGKKKQRAKIPSSFLLCCRSDN